jgi:hypothetical protein
MRSQEVSIQRELADWLEILRSSRLDGPERDSMMEEFVIWAGRNREKFHLASISDVDTLLGRHLLLDELVRGRQVKLVQTVPGTRLSEITRFLLAKGSYRRYVVPVIADMQHEYVEAIAAGDKWHARWIAVRGHLLVLPGWLYGFLARAVKRIFTA